MNPEASVILSAYNQPRELEAVLSGYCRQSLGAFEIVVADDGSGPEIRALVDWFASRAPFALRHVYQPDEGFRKSRVLNAAVRQSRSEYLIFADEDCVPHRDFVRAHWEHRASRTVLCGRRVLLSRELSRAVTAQQVAAGALERFSPSKIMDALLGRGSHWDEAIPVTVPFLHNLLFRREPGILGSNFSLEKSLYREIKGFDEAFVGYGGEETDLERRLRLAGARFRWVTHRAIQYHLYHAPRQETLRTARRASDEARPTSVPVPSSPVTSYQQSPPLADS